MKTKKRVWRSAILLVACFLGFQLNGVAQTPASPPSTDISIWQFRKVSNDKRDEFVKRETTYWAEVARKALAKGNLTFWCLLEKVGGADLENAPNFIFINTYKDIDAAGAVWNPAAAFPNVAIEKMETNSLSKTTSMFFLRDQDWQQGASTVDDRDLKYVEIVYHKSNDPSHLIDLEKKYWAPFVKNAMDKKQTTETAWGNAIVLSPGGTDMPFNSVSFDFYASMKDAINQWWDNKVQFPTDGLTEIQKIETGRNRVIYQIVKVVVPTPPTASK